MRHAFTFSASFRAHLARRRRVYAAFCALAAVLAAPTATQNAVANGDTRTLTLVHAHTGESASITFRVGGSYDSAALEKLNWLLRDWRRDEPTRMDPRVFDTVWEVYRMSGSHAPIKVMSAYRSPTTNAMLRRRSSAVAKHSQHMLGKAMDVHFQDVSMAKAREMGMRLQRGGVGYYPSANSPFVHLDVGSVRHWPRMSYDQLARIFPDGKTVHIPSNGQPLPGYDQALAEIEANGGSAYASAYVQSQKSKGLFAFLFGGGEEEEEEEASTSARGRGKLARGRSAAGAYEVAAAPSASSDDAGSRSFFSGYAPPQAPVEAPTLRTAMRAPRRGAVMPTPAPEPNVEVASVDARADGFAPSAAQLQPGATASAKAAEAQAKAAEAQLKAAEAKAAADAKAEELRARMEMRVADVPTPPRRPTAQMLAELSISAVPVPPSRPAEWARRADGKPGARRLSSLEDGALPSLITEGAGRSGLAAPALAYAADPASAPAAAASRPDLPKAPTPTMVAARIDRATFRALTAETPTERVTSQAALAPTLAPLRASRPDAKAGMLRQGVDVLSSFGDSPTGGLAVSRFSGQAIMPTPRPSNFGGLRDAPSQD